METFTFYSYKGGSGRSLLVANAARYLASLGKRVVALDFDLEAPGLHYKMHIGRSGTRTADVLPERGVVDYLLAAIEGTVKERRLTSYITPVPLPKATPGKLYLMPSGAAPSGEYWKALSALTRRDFFGDPQGAGIAACLELKARIEDEFKADFILIDSRTGITEMAGLATTLLADKVVCVMINNRESLAGARAVMRSFKRAPRLKNHGPIELLPVLSRVPDDNDTTRREVLQFLNEPGPNDAETLDLKKIFVLRADPELASKEKLHLSGENLETHSRLYKDYLSLLEAMVTADPSQLSAASRRHEAIAEMKDWLTESSGGRRHRRHTPNPFDEEQIDEGVELGRGEKRYADLVAYSGKDRSEPLMAVEYVEDLKSSTVWQWWQRNTNLRCFVLIGKEEGNYLKHRIFTRGKRAGDFHEQEDYSGWIVKWPASFAALDDPGDRSPDALVRAVQRGEDSFIGILVTEWQHASYATLHGGFPFRPQLARRILDGFAQVTDQEDEMHILWRTAPDPFERDYERDMRDGGSVEEQTTRELHAPLWWRFSVKSKIEFSQHRGPRREGLPSAGLDMLGRDLMGLILDQDADFRAAVERMAADEKPAGDGELPFYRFTGLFRDRELKFELSDAPPPELVRRAALEHILKDSNDRDSDSVWSHAGSISQDAMNDPRRLPRLIRAIGQKPQILLINLLAEYDPSVCAVRVYPKLVSWVARTIATDERALGSIAFLHATVYALCHIGRDLDGRMWENFGLPPARDLDFRPSITMETFARYFSLRLLERLNDDSMTSAFERINSCQPPEYRGWERLRSVPVEEVRRLLIQARAGADISVWTDGTARRS